MTQPRSREDVIQQDVADLHKLGYAQELFRSMGGFSNFAISFSIISILTGAVILYDYGLAWGGTAAVLIGWPLVTVFVLLIAASMGEIASAYPTAGGLYYWASRMKNKNWGWWTAWLNLIGQFAIVAGINWAAANFLNATIVTPILANMGIDYGNTTTILAIGDSIILTGALVTMGVLMIIELVLNIAGIRLVSMLNQVSVWWHIGIVALVVLLVFIAGKPDVSGLTLVRDPTPGCRRELAERRRHASRSTTARRSRTRSSSPSSSRSSRPTGRTPATTHRRTSPKRRSALASRARGGSSCRSRCRRSWASSSCSP